MPPKLFTFACVRTTLKILANPKNDQLSKSFIFCVHTTLKILPNPKTMKNLPNLNDTNSQYTLTLLFSFFETLFYIKYASCTLFLHAEGTRRNNKVHDFYLREYICRRIQRLITGVRLFSNGDVLPFT